MLNIAGSALVMKEQFAEATPILQRAQMLLLQTPDLRRELAENEIWLGIAYRRLGQLSEAERVLRDAIETIEMFDSPQPSLLASALHNLAIVLGQQGAVEESISLLQRTLSSQIRSLGEDHPFVARLWLDLGSLLHRHQRHVEAESAYRKALSIQSTSLGREQPDTADVLSNLGLLHQAMGHHHEAEVEFRKALAIWEKTLGSRHPRVHTGYYNLAINLYQAGRIQEAERSARKAFEIEMEAEGYLSPTPYGASMILALVLDAQDRKAEAKAVALRGFDLFMKASLKSHPPVSSVEPILNGYLELFRHLGIAEHLYSRQLEDAIADAET
ncbi:tetratricopeptide repeat protein [Acidisarcina polymorpha]|nr:tetratricopeptide repeat protein [Acidisarcina polymorpha]